jgi:hypothetical protein
MVKKTDLLLIFILFCFGVFFIYLYFYIESTQRDIKNRIIEEKVEHVNHILKNIKKR